MLLGRGTLNCHALNVVTINGSQLVQPQARVTAVAQVNGNGVPVLIGSGFTTGTASVQGTAIMLTFGTGTTTGTSIATILKASVVTAVTARLTATASCQAKATPKIIAALSAHSVTGCSGNQMVYPTVIVNDPWITCLGTPWVFCSTVGKCTTRGFGFQPVSAQLSVSALAEARGVVLFKGGIALLINKKDLQDADIIVPSSEGLAEVIIVVPEEVEVSGELSFKYLEE